MRYADIKKASEDEWQNQTTKTLITSKNLCPFQKTKLNNTVKIASNKTENKQNNLKFSRTKMVFHQFIIKLGTN